MTQSAAQIDRHIHFAGWIRIVLRSLALIALLLVCLPLHFIWSLFVDHNPWPRRFLRAAGQIIGLRIDLVGQRPQPGSFIVANHVSWMDIPVLAGQTGTTFVAQDGLAEMAWLRWLCTLHHTVFIARDRKSSVADQVEQVREALHDTGALTIFPEGTTGDGVGLLPFKSSLLSALTPVPPGISVQPVWIDYGRDAPQVAWVGDEPGRQNYLMIAARAEPIPVTVHLLTPLSGDALADRKTITAAAREAIEGRWSEVRTGADQRVAL